MRKFLKLSQISLFAGIFLTSCLGSKFLEEDQKILAKQRVVGVSGSLADNSTGLFEEKRNSRVILGYPFTHLAHLYKMGENGFIFKGYDKQKAIAKRDSTEAKYDKRIALAKSEKKEKRLKNKKAKKYDKRNRKVQQGNQLMRWGEPLSIYSHASTRLTAEKIRQYLSSKGYFEATIKIDTSNYDSLGSFGKFGRDLRDWVSGWAGNKGRYINLDYHIDLNNQFYIDSIEYQIEDPLLAELVAENLKEAPLQEDFYDQEHLSEERDFLYDLAVNNGYYEFSKQYIGFQIDSTMLGKDTLTVRTVIKNPPGESQHKIFYIDSVVFISDASITQSELRTEEQFGDVTFSFAKNRYSKKVLSWRIPLEQDDPYSRDLT
ncbi:MAG: hypothetical protein HRT61_15425, partial [Ekhidna sp.]|nr:hypothetical protein [Ekhidna sp.]